MNSDSKIATPKLSGLPGTLYLVATPIGNLGDITLRALETLKSVDIIYCEDTRVSTKLLRHYSINTPLKLYHDHSDEAVRKKIISLLTQGANIALISDAGTPVISDPGYKLVRESIAHTIRIETIPGACAAISGLVLSGIPTDNFYFHGFLANKKHAREAEVHYLATHNCTLILYESPRRLSATLKILCEILGSNRRACIARELTKLHEEICYGTLAELHKDFSRREHVKGEIVIIIDKPTIATKSAEEVEAMIRKALQANQPIKALAEDVASATGQSKRQIYNRALELRDGK